MLVWRGRTAYARSNSRNGHGCHFDREVVLCAAKAAGAAAAMKMNAVPMARIILPFALTR